MLSAITTAIDVKITAAPDHARDWVDYLTLLFAFLAAIGTVGAVAVALWQTSSSRRRVAWLKTRLTSDGMGVYVTNSGPRPFTVESVSFRAATGADMFPRPVEASRDSLPTLLTEGQTAQYVFEHRQGPLNDDERPELVIVRSAAGDEWTCFYNPFANISRPRRFWLDTFGRIAAEVVQRSMPLP